MNFINAMDITDAILVGRVTAGNLFLANEAIVRLAATYGVAEADIVPSDLLKRYGIVEACRACCLELVGTDATVQLGTRQDDIYERKYKLYDDQAKSILKELTASDFAADSTSREGSSWTKTVTLYRG